MNKSSKIVAITGPTASGKSDLAISIAEKLNGEIINSDSVQVFKGMDIGSAKPLEEDLLRVKHHLVSYINPDQEYSVGRFRKDCFTVIDDLIHRGKLPVLVGGSGLYLTSLFSEFLDDSWIRYNSGTLLDKLKMSLSREAFSEWVKSYLNILDRDSDRGLEEADLVRRERSLENCLNLGVPVSRMLRTLSSSENKLQGLLVIVERDRGDLYQRIDQRVEQMFEMKFLEEVRDLVEQWGEKQLSFKAIGYSHIAQYFSQIKQGLNPSFEGLKKIIQRDTRRFAKRQLTWWRNQPNKLGWIDLFSQGGFDGPSDGPLVAESYSDLVSVLVRIVEKFEKKELSEPVYFCRVLAAY